MIGDVCDIASRTSLPCSLVGPSSRQGSKRNNDGPINHFQTARVQGRCTIVWTALGWTSMLLLECCIRFEDGGWLKWRRCGDCDEDQEWEEGNRKLHDDDRNSEHWVLCFFEGGSCEAAMFGVVVILRYRASMVSVKSCWWCPWKIYWGVDRGEW